jgi:lipopolysaccharide/colanic/teichoic acid biosynthesis glycosyltransferase
MSLVGPRPSPFRENQVCIPWREARLSVRPGITGLWQICRHERSSGDFHQWIYYDLLYVDHMSSLLDMKILVATTLSLGDASPSRFRGSCLLRSFTSVAGFLDRTAPTSLTAACSA